MTTHLSFDPEGRLIINGSRPIDHAGIRVEQESIDITTFGDSIRREMEGLKTYVITLTDVELTRHPIPPEEAKRNLLEYLAE